jgi:Na+/glutamate symporter
MLEVQKATLDVAGASRLEQIRAAMGGQTAVEGGTGAAGAIGPGTASPSFEKTEQTAQRPENA